ncbi:MAG: hypothetical protein LJE68_14175 [Rhodobacter sp.]|jgi:hypothetical protein|nr:hypothetical protein [Rhodobacter sp.]
MAERKAEGDSEGKFKPGWLLTAMAFFLGLATSSVGIGEKVYTWCCKPPEDAPEMVAGYFAIPLDNIHDVYGEEASLNPHVDLFKVLSDFRLVETDIYQDAIEDAYAFQETVNTSGTEAWATVFDDDRSISYEPYLFVLMLKNTSDRAISSGTLHFETFELSRKPHAINQFQLAYDIIEDGCLKYRLLPECLLEVGEARPVAGEMDLPQFLPNQALYVPLAHVQVPKDFWPEIPMHYLIGNIVFPTTVDYNFGFGDSVEINVRDPLKEPYRLELDPDILGLG